MAKKKLTNPELVAKFEENIENNPDAKLNDENLNKVWEVVKNDKRYGAEYNLIGSILCKKQFKYNTDPEIVALKIALIDVTNSTQISKQKSKVILEELAKVIADPKFEFDDRVSGKKWKTEEEKKQGFRALVHDLAARLYADENEKKKTLNLLSFASKYCFYHNHFVYGGDAFMKYDRIVSYALPYYAKKLGENAVKTAIGKGITQSYIAGLKKNSAYAEFDRIVEEVLDGYGIRCKNRKAKFDWLMWFYNREISDKIDEVEIEE